MASTCHALIVASVLLTCVSAQYGAMPAPKELSPRFYLGLPPQLAERQSGGCAANAHSCLDINSTVCCLNTQYCYISNNEPQCCAIGSLCDSKCPASQYQCGEVTTTVSGTATVSASCCGRACPSTSAFLCASEYGGGCCPYGFACASGGSCQSTATPSSSAVVTEIPSGCITSQIACPSSVGGGCCNDGLSCTVVDNTNYCASGTGAALRTGPHGVLASSTSGTSSKTGLSTGAKAGLGVGLALVFCLIGGALLWFFTVHRRRAQQDDSPSTTATMSEVTSKRPLARRQTADYFGPAATIGPYTSEQASPGTSPRGVPLSPHGPGDITTAVEIDSREQPNISSPRFIDAKTPETNVNRLELP